MVASRKKLLRNKYFIVWVCAAKKEIKIEVVNRKKAINIEMDFLERLLNHDYSAYIPRLFKTQTAAMKYIAKI